MQTTMDVLRLISLVICLFISVRCEDAVEVKKATSSSVFSNNKANWGPQLAWKGQSKGDAGYFHSKYEANPWLQIEFTKEERLSSITIINRINCCGDRLRNVQIRAGSNNELVGVFKGPGASGGVYEVPFKGVVTARFMSFQIIGKGILQINGLRFKRAPPVKATTAPVTLEKKTENPDKETKPAKVPSYELIPEGQSKSCKGYTKIGYVGAQNRDTCATRCGEAKFRAASGVGVFIFGKTNGWCYCVNADQIENGMCKSFHTNNGYNLYRLKGPMCDESAASLAEFASIKFERCDEAILKHKTMCDDPSIKQACCLTCEG